MLGLSLNPAVSGKFQFPVVSYPLRAGTGYEAKAMVCIHWLYIARIGAGIGYHQFSHRHYIQNSDPLGVKKIKSKWSNLSIPVKAMGVIPIKEQVTPFFEFEASFLLPKRITQVEKYDGEKRSVNSGFYRSDMTCRTFKIGGLYKGDDGFNELAFSLDISFMNDHQNNFRYIGIGLSFQYFLVVAQHNKL